VTSLVCAPSLSAEARSVSALRTIRELEFTGLHYGVTEELSAVKTGTYRHFLEWAFREVRGVSLIGVGAF